jgi:porin
VRLAAGNALNRVGGIALEPYGDPLEDELQDINGRGRNHLLEAWYRHDFELAEEASLALTAGIIDAGEYLGENEFADESDAQFMNEALETSNMDMLSYNPGAILELEIQDWSFNLVYTQSENEQGSPFNWVSGQVGYQLETRLGEGNYRFFAFTSDGAFTDAAGMRDDERFSGMGLSFDQEIGEIFGGFVRIICANDNAVVDFNRLWSGGVNISGRLWGRQQDNAGIGYAYLEGPPGSELRRADVAEAYVRFQVTRQLDVSLDLQYQDNKLRPEDGSGDDDDAGRLAGLDNPSAWVAGLRINLVF